jgi:pimeloyl-ACP methyl ester carboxylesterase
MISIRMERIRPLVTLTERALVVGALLGSGATRAPAQVASTTPAPEAAEVTFARQGEPDVERTRPPRFGEVRLATGVRVRYAEQGAADGAPVILLHGYTDTWFSFSRALPRLPDELRVFALDQRGHGGSEGPDAAGYGLDELAADVVAFMDATGLERATVVGHSMGSLVAQRVALRAPERVERLVLVGAGTTLRRAVDVADLERAIDELADPVDPEFVRAFQEGTVHAPVPPAFMEQVIADSGRMPARVWKALLEGMLDAGPAKGLDELGIPTLILWGERDGLFTLEEQEALMELTGGGTLKIYPETGHGLHWERPDPFARDVTEFVLSGTTRGGRRSDGE